MFLEKIMSGADVPVITSLFTTTSSTFSIDGKSNIVCNKASSIMDLNPRAPVFLLIAFSAITFKESFEKVSFAPSISNSLEYCLTKEFLGSSKILINETSLIKILEEPKNSLVKQYAKLFEIEGAKLTFSKDSLKAIAEKAIKRKTGARGLRSIIEEALLQTMFDLPSMENVEEVVVNKEVITGTSAPLIIFSKNTSKETKVAN